MSSYRWVVDLKELIAARAAKAAEAAAGYLATQWSLVHPGSSQEQTFEAHVEQEGTLAKAVIDSKIAMYLAYGTGIYGLPETEPHRQTPWVYMDASGDFRTTWGTHPHPDYKAVFDDAYETMLSLMTDVMSGD
jgi:hypothetical protein